MSAFEPRKILKKISNPLLREFFTQRGELLDIPWDELTEHKMDPVADAISTLSTKAQAKIMGVLRDIHYLSTPRAIPALIEEMRYGQPDAFEELQQCEGHADKAMWAHLHAPDVFNRSIPFARADALFTGRSWKCRRDLPHHEIKVTEDMCSALGRELSQYFDQNQGRGLHHQVLHEKRLGKTDFFFVNLDNYLEKDTEYDDLEADFLDRSSRRAFEIVFAYTPSSGVLDVSLTGGESVWLKVQPIFTRAVLGIEIAASPSWKPSFNLDQLLDFNKPFPTDPQDRIVEVRVTRLKLGTTGKKGYVEIKVDQYGPPSSIQREVQRWLNQEQVNRSGTRVYSATFQLTFAQDERGKSQTMSFDISSLNSCTLKSKPDELREIGERCLQRWGICS